MPSLPEVGGGHEESLPLQVPLPTGLECPSNVWLPTDPPDRPPRPVVRRQTLELSNHGPIPKGEISHGLWGIKVDFYRALQIFATEVCVIKLHEGNKKLFLLTQPLVRISHNLLET